MDIAEQLERLSNLRQSGAITEDEFSQAKARLLEATSAPPPIPGVTGPIVAPAGPAAPADIERRTREWGLFLHLSVLAGWVVPLAGLVVPIVIWQVKKDELPGLDAHGKNALNWIISELIYLAGAIILTLVLVGIPLLVAVCVASVVFPIIAAIKANNGETWKYPLAIPFVT